MVRGPICSSASLDDALQPESPGPGVELDSPGGCGRSARASFTPKWGCVAVFLLAVLLAGCALAKAPVSESSASQAAGRATLGPASSLEKGTASPLVAWPATSPTAQLTRVPSGLESAGTNASGFPEFINPRDGTVLVRIPGGTFQMGSNEGVTERPIHSVTLPPYLMARVPVTNAQFARFVSATGHARGPATGHDVGSGWREQATELGERAPVVYVNWDDVFAKDRFLYRRAPDTPAYAQTAQRLVNPSYIVIGLKGSF